VPSSWQSVRGVWATGDPIGALRIAARDDVVPSILPEPIESVGAQLGISHRVHDVAVALLSLGDRGVTILVTPEGGQVARAPCVKKLYIGTWIRAEPSLRIFTTCDFDHTTWFLPH
jgi:hypothetical protein